jgi:DNA-binding response OmpR family regulator
MAKILCVEDEEFLRSDIAAELEYAGYEVLQACDGVQGLQAVITHRPDLILCDITMPNMNGHQLLRIVRDSHAELAEMPFIFMSALADRTDVLDGLRLGADDYLTKPVDYDLLLTKIDAQLRQIQQIRAKKSADLQNLVILD